MQYTKYAIIKIGGGIEAEVLAFDIQTACITARSAFIRTECYVLRYHTALTGDLYFLNMYISYN